jgi:hypothetical protein
LLKHYTSNENFSLKTAQTTIVLFWILTWSVSADLPTPPLPTMMTLWSEAEGGPFLDILSRQKATAWHIIQHNGKNFITSDINPKCLSR